MYKFLVTMITAVLLSSTAYASEEEVLETYADIALANFKDAKKSAEYLETVLEAFVEAPSKNSLKNAKSAYIAARKIYQQTEVFRFGNPTVDDFEGKVNAWPLDEGLIDYVDYSLYGEESEENPYYTANIIANKQIKIAGQTIDTSVIDTGLIREFQEIEEVESNVATGYHAIEFLLWGQDLNGNDAGAGERSYTDYIQGMGCTNGNCDRRADYLLAAAEALVEDLSGIIQEWEEGGQALVDLEKNGIKAIFQGMGSLAYGELAGERTKLGLMLGDPEEEHDCFSDLTHVSHYYDAKGIRNIYYGVYRSDYGARILGKSVRHLIAESDPVLVEELDEKVAKMMQTAKVMYQNAQDGETFDMMIASGNEAGNQVVQDFVDALVDFSKSLQESLEVLELEVEFEGSDALDNPDKV